MTVPTDTAADTARPTNRTLLAGGLVLLVAAIPLAILLSLVVHPNLLITVFAFFGVGIILLRNATGAKTVNSTGQAHRNAVALSTGVPTNLRSFPYTLLHRRD